MSGGFYMPSSDEEVRKRVRARGELMIAYRHRLFLRSAVCLP